MAEAIGTALAVVALLEPAIKGTLEAYGLFRLTEAFGSDYGQYTRKLEGQRARLEEWSQWPIDFIPRSGDRISSIVLEELGAMTTEFASCARLRAKYQQGSNRRVLYSEASPEQSKSRRPALSRPISRFLQHGRHRSSTSSSYSSNSRDSLQSNTNSTLSMTTSATSASAISNSPFTFQTFDISEAVEQQRHDTRDLQDSASYKQKATWIIKDREDYKASVEKITESNDLIESLVRARILKTLHPREISVHGSLPKEISNTQDTLERLHNALIHSDATKDRSRKIVYGIKLAREHTDTAEKVAAKFSHLPLRDNSYVYTLQSLEKHSPNQSRLMLAETQLHSSDTKTKQLAVKDYDDLDPFTYLGEISPRGKPSDGHRLYVDSSSPWAPAKDLSQLLNSSVKTPEYSVRYRLAALIAISYLHFANISHASSKSLPNNYKYFDWEDTVADLDEIAIIEDEDRLLNIYHFAGFGSPPPRESTRFFGGASGTIAIHDPQIVDLGLLLYQIGCWEPLHHGDVRSTSAREKLRDTVSNETHKLHREAGRLYAETVQRCLDWKVKSAKERVNDYPRFYYEIVKSLVKLAETFQVRLHDVS